MPNIREQSAPSDIGLRPTEMGVDARAAVARRGGAFYNQAAEAMNDTGRRVASTINELGDIAVKYEDHREISAGAATFAKMQFNLTKQWNDTAKNSDPNDPSVAAKFREEVVEPALDNFKAGFNTERSQQFAEQKSEALRNHLFEKTAADQSTLAGIAVRDNLKNQATALSNTAITDPSAVPELLKGVDHSIKEMVGSSPTLSPADAARASTELSGQTKTAIVHAGAQGAIQKSSNPEATAEEWIKKYPEHISGDVAKALAGNARQQIRANNYDTDLTRRRLKEAALDRSNEATAQYLIQVRSQDPKLANDPTAKTILNDSTLTKTDKNNLLNYIDRQAKPETDARLSQQSFVGLLRELRAPDADPDKVMQKAWDARLTDPGKPGSMSEKDFNQFRAEVVARKTPEGAALEHDRGQFFKTYSQTIAGGPSSSYDPKFGDPKVYAAEMDARRVEADLKRKGLDPHLAYDPASEYFLGKQQRLQKWQQSMQQDLSTRAAAPSKNLTADGSVVTGIERIELPPAEPAKRTVDNVYDTPKGKMKWTGTGWVKP